MKKAVFLFLFFVLFVPLIQNQLKIFPLQPLNGVINSTEKPIFNFKHWWNGVYQTDYNKYENETFGLRNLFIRIFNQFDFSLFNKPNGELVIGQNNYLFQGTYLNEVIGWNHIGEQAMKINIKNIHTVEKYLDKKNIFLFTVLAPGKSDYYKEYLPEFYLKRITSLRNYTSLLMHSKKENIRLIDFNNWFLQLKDTSRYPLFPKQGIHWSQYGMALSADSIVKFIESEKNITLPKISWSLEISDTLKGTDYDLGDLLNIYKKLPFDKMAYPNFKFTYDSITSRPRLLVVGDSFYWTIYNDGIFNKVFNNETFYYYCSTVHSKGKLSSNFVSDLNFLKEIKKFDVIILLQSSGNYGNPGVNFIQTLMNELARYDVFNKNNKIKIINNKILLNRAKEISVNKNLSQDSAISFLSDSITDYTLEEISKIKIQIRQNPDWMKYIIQKSEEQKKSVDQIMQTDAEWILKQEAK